MKTFNIALNEQELNVVLGSLGKQQYELVFQVIHKIRQQAIEQQSKVEDEGKFIVD